MLRKRLLGSTGFEVTELGFGGMPIGGTLCGDVTENDSIAAIETYLEEGGNFIDTARVYFNSERIIGNVISKSGKREKIFLATKTEGGRSLDTIPQIREDLVKSLTNLKTDYVDILYLHQPPEDIEIMNQALDEFEKLKKERKIRAIGASIKGPNVTDKTEALCFQYMSTKSIDVIQLVYSILRQRLLNVIFEAHKKGIGIVARTTLESGLLTGRYSLNHRFANKDHRTRYNTDRLKIILQNIQELKSFAVKPPYKSLAQVAIRFSLEPKGVSTIILGVENEQEVRKNFQVFNLPPLDRNLVQKLKNEYETRTKEFNITS